MMKRLPVLVLAFLPTLVQAQAGPGGRWHETTPSGLNAELELATEGTKVTGTFTVRGRQLAISDGEWSQNTFRFKALLEDKPEGFSGEIAGDQITLWRDRNGRGDAVTLKRAAPPSLTGRWEGQTPNGLSLALDLAASGEVLTGTLTREGQATAIRDGKAAKGGFTFTATLGEQTESFTGRLDGDRITVWLNRQGPERTATLKRVKK